MGLSHVGEPDGEAVGCTGALAYVYEKNLVIANLGDTEIVSCHNGKAVLLTKRHDLSDKEEVYRLRQAGGYVNSNHKLNNVLTYTRGFLFFIFLFFSNK